MELDLFGNEYIKPIEIKSNYQQWKYDNNYRKAEKKDKRCKNCEYHCSVHYAKVYHKCKLLGCSASEATDIRVNNVCDSFKEQ